MTNSQPPKSEKSFSEVLLEIAGNIPPEGLTLRNILEKVGSQGLLPLCMLLTIPFLLPISLPGSSLPFGFLIALIGFGRLFDRPPWLPARFLNRRLTAAQAGTLLGKGSRFFARLEKYIHPRLYFLTHADTTGRVNSVALIVTAICLTAPLPLPFTNTFPAYGVPVLGDAGTRRGVACPGLLHAHAHPRLFHLYLDFRRHGPAGPGPANFASPISGKMINCRP